MGIDTEDPRELEVLREEGGKLLAEANDERTRVLMEIGFLPAEELEKISEYLRDFDPDLQDLASDKEGARQLQALLLHMIFDERLINKRGDRESDEDLVAAARAVVKIDSPMVNKKFARLQPDALFVKDAAAQLRALALLYREFWEGNDPKEELVDSFSRSIGKIHKLFRMEIPAELQLFIPSSGEADLKSYEEAAKAVDEVYPEGTSPEGEELIQKRSAETRAFYEKVLSRFNGDPRELLYKILNFNENGEFPV